MTYHAKTAKGACVYPPFPLLNSIFAPLGACAHRRRRGSSWLAADWELRGRTGSAAGELRTRNWSAAAETYTGRANAIHYLPNVFLSPLFLFFLFPPPFFLKRHESKERGGAATKWLVFMTAG